MLLRRWLATLDPLDETWPFSLDTYNMRLQVLLGVFGLAGAWKGQNPACASR